MKATSSVVRFGAAICLIVLALVFLAFVAAELIDWSFSEECPYLLLTLGFVGVWCSITVASWRIYFRRRSSLQACTPIGRTD
ncbi:MAG: hypothetical protein HYR85_21320 [Planctomycetes bacterium]|nr:hypothetical protein [Planctomycetota bacterium]MBI3847100.1 hypothetical protein [Planctomycetota bacterium]